MRKKLPHHSRAPELRPRTEPGKCIVCPECSLLVPIAGVLVSYHASFNGCTWDGPLGK